MKNILHGKRRRRIYENKNRQYMNIIMRIIHTHSKIVPSHFFVLHIQLYMYGSFQKSAYNSVSHHQGKKKRKIASLDKSLQSFVQSCSCFFDTNIATDNCWRRLCHIAWGDTLYIFRVISSDYVQVCVRETEFPFVMLEIKALPPRKKK